MEYLAIILQGLEAIALAAMGALWNRGAGGLWSQWAGKSLGDLLPRLAWGGVCVLPLIAHRSHITAPWLSHTWALGLALVGAAVLQGLARGVGWGSSLTLGFKAPRTSPTRASWKLGAVFYSRAFLMNLPIIGALALFNQAPLLLLGLPLLALGWLEAYFWAWMEPLDIPKLGCLPQDPPPTGELLSGGLTLITVFILSLM